MTNRAAMGLIEMMGIREASDDIGERMGPERRWGGKWMGQQLRLDDLSKQTF